MEQRLQDIANLFNPLPAMGVGMGVSEMSPYSHYPTHYPYQVWKFVIFKSYHCILNFELFSKNQLTHPLTTA